MPDSPKEIEMKRARKPGEFCWFNLLTPRSEEARAFYSQLLGWSYSEIPGVGHTVLLDGQPIGALFDLRSPGTPPGTPPLIGVVVRVDDADAAARRVAQLGGTHKPPFDVLQAGRMAVCTDPAGAQFDVWQPKQNAGTEVDPMQPGAPSWIETISSDVPAATRFYAELFGWKPEAMPGPKPYTVFSLDGEPAAGMLPLQPEMPAKHSHWGTYFTVADADATAREALALGATLCVPPMDVPTVGRLVGIVSPQGVPFYAIHYRR
jgi:predicted enzyme related to lactoylglutathione lyase